MMHKHLLTAHLCGMQGSEQILQHGYRSKENKSQCQRWRDEDRVVSTAHIWTAKEDTYSTYLGTIADILG